jgi:hypothetical protein
MWDLGAMKIWYMVRGAGIQTNPHQATKYPPGPPGRAIRWARRADPGAARQAAGIPAAGELSSDAHGAKRSALSLLAAQLLSIDAGELARREAGGARREAGGARRAARGGRRAGSGAGAALPSCAARRQLWCGAAERCAAWRFARGAAQRSMNRD